MKSTTCIRNNKDEHVREEKLCTLQEYISMRRLKPGQNLLVGDVEVVRGREVHVNTHSFWIGDATPYHEESTSDLGLGWNFDNQIMSKYVLEVTEY